MNTNKISVIGVGRLGLSAALVFEKYGGYEVLGCDLTPSYVESLNNKSFFSYEPSINEYLKAATRFRASTSIKETLDFSDVIFIFVDTPTGSGDKSYDHSKLSRVLSQINDLKVKGKHIQIGCTVSPGYIATVGRFLISDCENCYLSYNPEFIAQGAIISGFKEPDMVLIGEGSKESGDILEQIYLKICQNKPIISRMTPESAEITKLAINCFITTKISFANMIGDIAAHTPNSNKIDILKAVGADSRIGNKYLQAGYGFGGPCFPRDNRALGNYADSIGVSPYLPRATDEYNKFHAQFLKKELISQNKDEYIFEDVCYKAKCPVPIIEESHKLIIARSLAIEGKRVIIKDRKIVLDEVKKEFGNLFQYLQTD